MGGAKGVGSRSSFLKRLRAEEAHDVLRRLLANHPDLDVQAEKIARALLGEVTFETIADEVEEAVCALGVDDLNARAGRQAWGYVEPTEAAWEFLGDAVEPFVADMKRRIELGLEPDALEICKGVVLGLYRAEHGKRAELVEWAPDCPAETACDAIDTLRSANRRKRTPGTGSRRIRRALPQEFVDRFVPEWRDMIARIGSRR